MDENVVINLNILIYFQRFEDMTLLTSRLASVVKGRFTQSSHRSA